MSVSTGKFPKRPPGGKRKSTAASVAAAATTFSSTLGSSSSGITSAAARLPAVDGLLTIALGIKDCCEKMISHVNQCNQLIERCEAILEALVKLELGSAQTDSAITRAKEAFGKIKARMQIRAAKSRWENFVQEKEVIEEFYMSNQELDYSMESLSMNCHIRIIEWKGPLKASTERDHQEMVTLLGNIAALQNATKDLQLESRETLVEMMRLIQTITRDPGANLSSLARFGLASNLYTFQMKSGEPLPINQLSGDEVTRIGRPIAATANADVYEAQYLKNEKAAVKVLTDTDKRSIKRMQREADNWQDACRAVIDHQTEVNGKKIYRYILPMYGYFLHADDEKTMDAEARRAEHERRRIAQQKHSTYYHDDTQHPFLVSPLCEKGTVIQYVIREDDNVDYLEMFRDIAFAVQVLHTLESPVTHSDIKASNILVSDEGRPLLADFGMSRRLKVVDINHSRTAGNSNSQRWQAPELTVAESEALYKGQVEELYTGQGGRVTTSADIWSLAMTFVELLTHRPPFADTHPWTGALWGDIKRGIRPKRPTEPEVIQRGLNDTLWTLLEKCWLLDPMARPSIGQVVDELDAMLNAARDA